MTPDIFIDGKGTIVLNGVHWLSKERLLMRNRYFRNGCWYPPGL